MFVTFLQEMTTFDVHVFYKIIMRKMYHSSRLLRQPTRFSKLGYILLDKVTYYVFSEPRSIYTITLIHIDIGEKTYWHLQGANTVD